MNDLSNWITENKDILESYERKFVAITEDGIIASGDHWNEVDEVAKKQKKKYIHYFVPNIHSRLPALRKNFVGGQGFFQSVLHHSFLSGSGLFALLWFLGYQV